MTNTLIGEKYPLLYIKLCVQFIICEHAHFLIVSPTFIYLDIYTFIKIKTKLI